MWTFQGKKLKQATFSVITWISEQNATVVFASCFNNIFFQAILFGVVEITRWLISPSARTVVLD